MDSFATLMSVALQHGVPLQVMTEKLAHTRFEPSGWSGNEKMGYAKSPMDYLGRWMQYRFLEGEQLALFALPSKPTADTAESNRVQKATTPNYGDAPTCGVCDSLMLASGSCFHCVRELERMQLAESALTS
jgi:ribonucleoside-diphosphate reductase alpha chain